MYYTILLIPDECHFIAEELLYTLFFKDGYQTTREMTRNIITSYTLCNKKDGYFCILCIDFLKYIFNCVVIANIDVRKFTTLIEIDLFAYTYEIGLSNIHYSIYCWLEINDRRYDAISRQQIKILFFQVERIITILKIPRVLTSLNVSYIFIHIKYQENVTW